MSYTQSIPTRLDQQWGVEPLAEHRIPLFGDALMSLVYRARNLERRNPIACATLDRCVENVIGTGIAIRPTSSSPKWNAAIKRLLKRVTTGKLLDARGMLTWLGIQKGIYRGVLRDGDIGILLVDEGNGPKIQLIDATAIATPTAGQGGDRTIRDGVELDAGGRPIAYWIRVNDGHGIESFTRVEARDLIFYHRSPRTDVIRGESGFNGGFRIFEQLDSYLESVVVGVRVAANICLIRKRKRRRGQGVLPTDANKAIENGRGETMSAVDLEPGTVVEVDVDEGDDVTPFIPNQPGQSFADTIRTFGRFCGLKFGLTVQRILLDFTATNYSVSRSTALQEQRFSEPEQVEFVEAFVRRFYQWLVSKWAKMGLIVDEDGSGIEEPIDSWSFEWIPPARPLTEPAKDAPGLKLMVGMNVESYRNIAEANGYDLDQIIIDNERDVKRMREAGIAPEGFLAAMNAAQPTDGADDEDRPDDPEEDDIDREDIDAYGIAVRAGVITPQTADEERFRRGMRLPEMSKEARAAWEEDKGIRRPVTLAREAKGSGSPFNSTAVIDGGEQESDDDGQQTED